MPAPSKRFQDDEALLTYLRIDLSGHAWKMVYRFYREPVFIYFRDKGFSDKIIGAILAGALAEMLEELGLKKSHQYLRISLLSKLLYFCHRRAKEPCEINEISPPKGYTYLAKKVLVHCLQQDDKDTIAKAIYDSFKKTASKAIGVKFSLSQEDIGSLYNEAMLALITRPPKDEGGKEAKLYTYFTKILHNKAVDLCKTLGKGDIPSGDLNDFNKIIDDLNGKEEHKSTEFWDYINEKHKVGEKFNVESALEFIEQLLARISPDCRKLLELRFLEEKKYKEIAEIIDSSIDTIGQRIRRCLKKMRSEL